MIERRAATKWITAIRTLVVPGQQDLITGRPPGDQAGFFNVVLIH